MTLRKIAGNGTVDETNRSGVSNLLCKYEEDIQVEDTSFKTKDGDLHHRTTVKISRKSSPTVYVCILIFVIAVFFFYT